MSRLLERNTQRTEGVAGQQPAATVACDELWTYRGVRRGEQRESRRIGTAVVAEKDGRRWVDLAEGDRSENTFLRWYDHLPEAAVYCSDRYAVYRWFPQDRHCAGRGGAWPECPSPGALPSALRWQRRGGELERRAAFGVAEQAELADAADERYTKSVEMPVYSLALVCGRHEAKPNICAH